MSNINNSTSSTIEHQSNSTMALNAHTGEEEDEEEDLEKLQAEIARMEEEAARIAQETANLEKQKAAKLGMSAGVSGIGSSHSSSIQSTKPTSAQGSNTTGNAAATNSGVVTSTGSRITSAVSSATSLGPGGATTAAAESVAAANAKRDGFSIYVGQVDYSATPEELLAHFEPCGTVERVTIVCDKFTGQPKGYAYLEFQAESAVENAVKLDGSTFKGRTLKVTPKRVNDPNFYYSQMTTGFGAGRGAGRGRAAAAMMGRGGPPGYHQYPAPFVAGGGPPPPFRGRGGRGPYRGGFRGGGYGGGYGAGYHPYY